MQGGRLPVGRHRGLDFAALIRPHVPDRSRLSDGAEIGVLQQIVRGKKRRRDQAAKSDGQENSIHKLKGRGLKEQNIGGSGQTSRLALLTWDFYRAGK